MLLGLTEMRSAPVITCDQVKEVWGDQQRNPCAHQYPGQGNEATAIRAEYPEFWEVKPECACSGPSLRVRPPTAFATASRSPDIVAPVGSTRMSLLKTTGIFFLNTRTEVESNRGNSEFSPEIHIFGFSRQENHPSY